MPPVTRRRRNNSISRSPYQHGGSNRRQSSQISQHPQPPAQQFQNYFANQQRSIKPLSHPIYNLSIPQPTPQESQFLNDEVDLYLIRGNILKKFEIENGLLDNVLLKNISCSEIIPPSSFPDSVVDSGLFDYEKFVEAKKKELGLGANGVVKPEGDDDGDKREGEKKEEEEEEKADDGNKDKAEEVNGDELVLAKVKENKIDDCLFGNLKLMKLKEQVMEEQLKEIENDTLFKETQNGTVELNDLVNEQYSYQFNKVEELYKVFSTYSSLKVTDYEKMMDDIQTGFQTKFNKKIGNEYQIDQKSVKSFESFKKSISYKDYKDLKLKTIEKRQLEQKRRQEEQERLQRINDEKLRKVQEDAKKQQEEQAKLQLHQQPPTAAVQATASTQLPVQHHPNLQPPIPASTMQAHQHPHPHPQAAQGTQASTGSAQHLSQQSGDPGYQDPFGADQGGNFDFDNLYGAGDELMIGDDGNDADFGALEDQVFLSNLDGSLD